MKKEQILDPQTLVRTLGNPEKFYHHKVIRTLSDAWGPWQQVKGTNKWWVFREGMRFVQNIYQPVLPFDQEFHEAFYSLWANTQFHTSIEDPGMVAFTPNPDDGVRDRQVRSKMGKFLKKYQGHFHTVGDVVISDFANRFNTTQTPPELRFTSDPQEIKRVYLSGPHSCMSEVFSKLPCHPVEVYGDSLPLELAYVVDKHQRILGRALTRKDSKLFVRPYGNEFALCELLTRAGYKFSESEGLLGLKLRWVLRDESTLVAPYLDEPTGYVWVCEARKEIIITNTETPAPQTGDVWFRAHWQTTSGHAYIPRQLPEVDEDDEYVCDDCGDHYHEDDLTRVNDDLICSSCLESGEDYVLALQPNGDEEWMYRDSALWINALDAYIPDGMSRSSIERHYRIRWCAHTESFEHIDSLVRDDRNDGWLPRDESIYVIAEDMNSYTLIEDIDLSECVFIISEDGEFIAYTKEYFNELQEASKTPQERGAQSFEELVTVVRAYFSSRGSFPLHYNHLCLLASDFRIEAYGPNPVGANARNALDNFLRVRWTAVRNAALATPARRENAA